MAARGVTVLVFDSGMGGLTVASAVRRRMGGARIFYAADTAAFPYGAWEEAQLVERICHVIGRLTAELRPDVVVIACNTASTLALEHLRERFHVPFVGTVPAIKPAAETTGSGIIGVLATEGTVSREYTRALIDTFAFHCEVLLHGSAALAELAERKMRGEAVPPDAVRQEIAPVFVKRGDRRTDVVVLGCTHYPLLLDEMRQQAPWPCTFVDPADAIARRALAVAGDVPPVRLEGMVEGDAFVTDAEGLDSAEVFTTFGFNHIRLVEMPVASGV
jgi:glutamate racemase